METPGSLIKRERELRGITLDEIAKETKISIRYLEALEEDDFDSLFAPTFVKGFLRAYSKFAGLDGDDIVLRYEDFMKRTEKGREVKKDVEDEGESDHQTRYRLIILVVTILGFISLLTIYILWRTYNPSSQQNSTEQKAEVSNSLTTDIHFDIPSKGIIIIKDEPFELKEYKEPLEKEMSQEDLTLSFKAFQDTWIWVEIDGDKVKEVLLRPGEGIEWKAEKGFFVIVGNAGGVNTFFKGVSLGMLGKTGEVVKLTLPSNPL